MMYFLFAGSFNDCLFIVSDQQASSEKGSRKIQRKMRKILIYHRGVTSRTAPVHLSAPGAYVRLAIMYLKSIYLPFHCRLVALPRSVVCVCLRTKPAFLFKLFTQFFGSFIKWL